MRELRQRLLLQPSPFRFPLLIVTASVAIFIGLAWRQHRFVDAYAVNVMSWDQWDFYLPLFQQDGWWATFERQHGPHRQGIGFVVTRILSNLSGWNSRWDAFAISWALIGAGILGLWLAKRCGARMSLALAAVALLFFNVRQDVAIIGAANLSHGAMPVLLFMAYLLTWFIRPVGVRLVLNCGLTFLLIFTGFGLFVGLLTPLLLVAEAVRAIRSKQKGHVAMVTLALLFVGFSWAAFARGYTFQPAVENFRFPYEKPWEYAEFAGLMLANFYGVPGHGTVAIAVGLLILAVLVVLCGSFGWRCLTRGPENEPRYTTIFCLSAYTVIFCANTAVGRVFLGLEGAPAVSRYVTLMIPAGLAIFLWLESLPSQRWVNRLAFAYVLLLLPGTLVLREADWAFARLERDGRLAWKQNYLATHDEKIANEKSNFRVYPLSVASRLRFLEERKLNLFNPAGKP